jgi:hypothetical protein
MFSNRFDLTNLTLVYWNKTQVEALLKKSDAGYT